jgi:hypothetical protein
MRVALSHTVIKHEDERYEATIMSSKFVNKEGLEVKLKPGRVLRVGSEDTVKEFSFVGGEPVRGAVKALVTENRQQGFMQTSYIDFVTGEVSIKGKNI